MRVADARREGVVTKAMKIGVLVPVLAVWSAPAYAGEVWRFDNSKRCTASTEFKHYSKETDEWPSYGLVTVDDPSMSMAERDAATLAGGSAQVIFERKHLAKLEAAVRFLKKCRAWVWDRHRGKALYLTPKEMKELE
jgi:hypothetical protein